jgi:hypothetical protein
VGIIVLKASLTCHGTQAIRFWRLYHPGPADRDRYEAGNQNSEGPPRATTKPSISHTIQGAQVLVSGRSFEPRSNVDFQITVRGSLSGATDLRTGYTHTKADASGSFSGLSAAMKARAAEILK